MPATTRSHTVTGELVVSYFADEIVQGSDLRLDELAGARRVTSVGADGRKAYVRGGFGDLWRAGRNGEYAIKCFTRGDAASARKEYEMLVSLRECDYVPKVFSVGTLVDENGIEFPAIVESYVSGLSLQQLISCGQLSGSIKASIDAKKAALIALEVSKALECLSSLGVAHRDLSVANIMLTEACIKSGLSCGAEVKLVDFGQSTWDARNTVTPAQESRLACVPYGAPEVFGGEFRPLRNSPKCDTWSLGAIIVSMMAGGEHWPPDILDLRQAGGLTSADLDRIVQAKRHPLDLLSAARITEPSHDERVLADIVRSCTEFNPHLRPSLAGIAATLQDFVVGFSKPEPVTPHVPKASRLQEAVQSAPCLHPHWLVYADKTARFPQVSFESISNRQRTAILSQLYEGIRNSDPLEGWRSPELWNGMVHARATGFGMISKAAFSAYFVGTTLVCALTPDFHVSENHMSGVLAFCGLWNAWSRETKMTLDRLSGRVTLLWSHDFRLSGGGEFDPATALRRRRWLELAAPGIYAISLGNCDAAEAFSGIVERASQFIEDTVNPELLIFIEDALGMLHGQHFEGNRLVCDAIKLYRGAYVDEYWLELDGTSLSIVRTMRAASPLDLSLDMTAEAINEVNGGIAHGSLWVRDDGAVCVSVPFIYGLDDFSYNSVFRMMSLSDELLDKSSKELERRGMSVNARDFYLSSVAMRFGNGSARAEFESSKDTPPCKLSEGGHEGFESEFPEVSFMPGTSLVRSAIVVASEDALRQSLPEGSLMEARLFGYADVGMDSIMEWWESEDALHRSAEHETDSARCVTQAAVLAYVSGMGGRPISEEFQQLVSAESKDATYSIRNLVDVAIETRMKCQAPFAVPNDMPLTCLYELVNHPWALLAVRMTLTEVGEASRLSMVLGM